jgi:hypothetical protein
MGAVVGETRGLVIGFVCGVIVSLAENVLNKFGKEAI